MKTESRADQKLRKARIILEIMEARFVHALDHGSDAAVGRAEIHLMNAHQRFKDQYAVTRAPQCLQPAA